MEKKGWLLSEGKLLNSFCGEVLLTVPHVIILSRDVSLQRIVPNNVWYEKNVFYDHLRVFGCKAFVLVTKMGAQSLFPRQGNASSLDMTLMNVVIVNMI